MGNFRFDIANGREAEFHWRVDNNDPTNSALILVVLAASGLEADGVLRTYADLATLLAASNNQVTNTGYARKTLTDADLSPISVDTTTHKTTLALPTQTFATISAGDTWGKLLGCYDSDTTGGTDANIVPVWANDIIGNAAVPNGGDIVFAWPNGYIITP